MTQCWDWVTICKPIGSILYHCKGLEKYRNQQKSTTSRTIGTQTFYHNQKGLEKYKMWTAELLQQNKVLKSRDITSIWHSSKTITWRGRRSLPVAYHESTKGYPNWKHLERVPVRQLLPGRCSAWLPSSKHPTLVVPMQHSCLDTDCIARAIQWPTEDQRNTFP